MEEDEISIIQTSYLAELEYNTQFLEILFECGLETEEIYEEEIELRESRLH